MNKIYAQSGGAPVKGKTLPPTETTDEKRTTPRKLNLAGEGKALTAQWSARVLSGEMGEEEATAGFRRDYGSLLSRTGNQDPNGLMLSASTREFRSSFGDRPGSASVAGERIQPASVRSDASGAPLEENHVFMAATASAATATGQADSPQVNERGAVRVTLGEFTGGDKFTIPSMSKTFFYDASDLATAQQNLEAEIKNWVDSEYRAYAAGDVDLTFVSSSVTFEGGLDGTAEVKVVIDEEYLLEGYPDEVRQTLTANANLEQIDYNKWEPSESRLDELMTIAEDLAVSDEWNLRPATEPTTDAEREALMQRRLDFIRKADRHISKEIRGLELTGVYTTNQAVEVYGAKYGELLAMAGIDDPQGLLEGAAAVQLGDSMARDDEVTMYPEHDILLMNIVGMAEAEVPDPEATPIIGEVLRLYNLYLSGEITKEVDPRFWDPNGHW